MDKQPPNHPQIIAGQARVECRVAVWARCPLCHQEHAHLLTACDHPTLSGLRYWRMDCQGSSYFLRVPSTAITAALARAADIAAEHDLNQSWLHNNTYENYCRDANHP